MYPKKSLCIFFPFSFVSFLLSNFLTKKYSSKSNVFSFVCLKKNSVLIFQNKKTNFRFYFPV